MIIDWIINNCRFATQQYLDFYNPTEYKPAQPLYRTQNQKFWQWVRTENNPNEINPVEALEAVLLDYPLYATAFLSAFKAIYNPDKVSFETGTQLTTVTINDEIYVLDSYSVTEAADWISNLNDMSLSDYIPERDFNKEFWDSVGPGYVLYHATPTKNVKIILKKGLYASDKTRGISNRGMGNAVFTGPEPTALESYGDAVIEIDVGAMKAAGYMPAVSQEEPFSEEQARSAIAWKLGLRDWVGGEYGSEGLSEDTIAFFGNIPPQFLKLY